MYLTKLILFLLLYNYSYAQKQNLWHYSDTLNIKRYKSVLITESVVAVSSVALLNQMWYKNYEKSAFHFFNDSKEWLQMDKFGHATTSYYIGLSGIELMKWSGVSGAKRSLIGGGLGFAYLFGVELLDGYSKHWGFSKSDVLANGLGTILVTSQDLMWKEQRIRLKFSAHTTSFSTFRPNLLGTTFLERILKDYNGQTIWCSVNIYTFLPPTSRFPKWINLALGIGAENMLSGEENEVVMYQGTDISANFKRYRQYYLSLDIDLTKIKYKQKWVKKVLVPFGLLKIPFPAIEYSNQQFQFHPFYF